MTPTVRGKARGRSRASNDPTLPSLALNYFGCGEAAHDWLRTDKDHRLDHCSEAARLALRHTMIGYFWIGLGGAFGSIARAWLAFTVARITGPQFPWGTILINVVGSFVIGFFGTLTASGSRFSVPPDARAFVMVGICGGFTTFSSFSLQTLELARDGRLGQALGNVGLSVILCLLVVAVGHYAAATINRQF
jgi:protein CrcB